MMNPSQRKGENKMKENLLALCESFIANRDTVKRVYKLESDYVYPCCANIFTSRGLEAEEEKLLECKRIIKSQAGVFSNFRGSIEAPLASFMALESDPEGKMALAQEYYGLLKQYFWGSEYLTLIAVLLTDLADRQTVDEKIARGREIYQRMKKEHPFLTSSEDSVFAVMLAFSEKDNDALIEEMEACYRLLKEKFMSSNSMQTVSHVLAMAEGTPEDKTDRLIRLYDDIRNAGGKYGKYHELATLAALSLQAGDLDETTRDMLDADEFLSQQKGYGVFGMDRRTRMMHAAMIVSDLLAPNEPTQAAALTGTLSMIAAQEMAMVAIIAASASASAASASSSH